MYQQTKGYGQEYVKPTMFSYLQAMEAEHRL